MKTFTIENETNNIIVHATMKEAEAVADSEQFSNEAALAKLASNWTAARLVETFNSLPGVTPVKKFTDRKTALSRIWKALQSFAENAPVVAEEAETTQVPEAVPVAEPEASEAVQPQEAVPETPFDAPVGAQTPDVAPEAAPATKQATRSKKTPTAATNTGVPREGSKTSQVIAMLKREGGTTLEEIMTEMGWLKHTVRAMLSAGGSLTKKHGLVIISEKVGDKRTYSIKA
jgi:hypothetical protein